jgi:hypothetical protein
MKGSDQGAVSGGGGNTQAGRRQTNSRGENKMSVSTMQF